MSSQRRYNVGIVGSTGAVGETVLAILEERPFPLGELHLFSSQRSEGCEQTFRGERLKTSCLDEESFNDLDFAIFTAGGAVSREYAPLCGRQGCIVIDNSSAFRMQEDVPLVVPEVNPGDLQMVDKQNIVANPNCSTIQMVVALAPIHVKYELTRVIVSTYQSVSGAGRRAMQELSSQVVALLNNREFSQEVFPHQIAFNCIPQVDSFEPSGYTREEMKVANETRKILHLPSLPVSATTVRVPTFCSHSESIYLETESPTEVDDVKQLLAAAPGIKVLDDPKEELYPLPFNAISKDEVFVGRIRKDLHNPHGLHLWVVADNLRKGAALNAVQIAETLIATKH